MKKIKIFRNNITEQEIKVIVNYFNQGKIVVYPTDTIYGMGCLANNYEAIDQIFRIKKRDQGKPLLVLVDSINMLNDYCYLDHRQRDYLENIWPGPVSVILESKEKLPKNLSAGLSTLAARLPKNELLVTMIKKLGVPIVSTSFNLSNQPILELKNIEKHFANLLPDLVVDAGRAKKTKPSKLLDIRDINNIKALRK